MNDITKLKEHLSKAMSICNDNIKNAHNIDLENIAQVLESFINDLNEIVDFETYDEDQ